MLIFNIFMVHSIISSKNRRSALQPNAIHEKLSETTEKVAVSFLLADQRISMLDLAQLGDSASLAASFALLEERGYISKSGTTNFVFCSSKETCEMTYQITATGKKYAQDIIDWNSV